MSAVAARRSGMPIGWWGMAMLVAAETALIGLMIGSYWYLRFKNLHWPPPGIPEPKALVPLVLAGVLVLTSVAMQRAHVAVGRGRAGGAARLVALALVVQVGYLVVALLRYADDLHHFRPQEHAYASIYYILLGADHAHVLVGVLLNIWLAAKLARGLTRYRRNATLAIALYWHAVNALTVLVTLTVVSPAL